MRKEGRAGRGLVLAGLLVLSVPASAGTAAAATDSAKTEVAICTSFNQSLAACPRFAKAPTTIRFGSTGKQTLTHLHWGNWGTKWAVAYGVLRTKKAGGGYTYKTMLASASTIGPCDGIKIYERLAVLTLKR